MQFAEESMLVSLSLCVRLFFFFFGCEMSYIHGQFDVMRWWVLLTMTYMGPIWCDHWWYDGARHVWKVQTFQENGVSFLDRQITKYCCELEMIIQILITNKRTTFIVRNDIKPQIVISLLFYQKKKKVDFLMIVSLVSS